MSHSLYEDESVLAFLDTFPVTKGHTLLVPKKHYDRFENLDDADTVKLSLTLRRLAPLIVKAVGADGFNFGLNNGHAAGQIIDHVHWHIIPRFLNDGLKSWPNRKVTDIDLSETASLISKFISKNHIR